MKIQDLSSLSRRIISSALVGALVGISSAHAAAPVEQTQVPGFYRQQVGNAVVTAVYDGYVALDPKALSGLSQQQIQQSIARMFQAKNASIQTAVNAFVVRTGSNLVLIDSGSSDCFGPTMGRMVQNLKAAGFKPEDVDTVLLTHMHPDHACGITAPDGKAAFPNATVWAAKKDADFWLNAASASRLPEAQRSFLKMAQDAVAPYSAKGRFKTFSDGDAIVPGISVVPSNGHTPGHSSYLVTSGADKMLVWGDIVHFHAVQLPHPEVTIEVDVEPKAAVASRQRVLAETARSGWLVAAAHHPFPGIGHVRSEGKGKGYAWVPVEYGDLPPNKK
ncbi:MBL fold metallo-hydrolase [Massilia niastensis]|uniref:MBL fold metallo-hydrolase n=1 Tax=Massilia niastensis TaxID=544911 RepID=UPI00035F3AD7|nr:MBL fold metallo-hydrolase [Massilia niastensis]